jgi:hypothetical protein
MPAIFPDFEIKITSSSGEERYVTALASLKVELCPDVPSDKAVFSIPSKDDKDLELFKEEDKVEISLGYKKGDNIPGLAKVFTGEITSLSRELPLVITAHDPFHRAKKEHVTRTYGTDSSPLYYTDIARDLLSKAGLSAVIPSEEDNGPGEKQHSVEFHNKTVAEAMAMLCERTQWTHFFIPGTADQVYFGPRWPYHRNYLEPGSGDTYVFIVGREGSTSVQDRGNIISSDDLEYMREKPYKEVVCQLYDTKQRFLSVSKKAEAEGETGPASAKIKLPYSFEGSDETSAKASAEEYAMRCAGEHLEMLNSQEIKGFFMAFGNPNLSHSHEIGIVWRGDKELSRHNGYYDAKRVIFTYSPRDGFHMQVHVSKPPLSKNSKEL